MTTAYVFLGSCFAAEMGARFAEAGRQAVVNPLGTLYNPASIAQAITAALDERPLDDTLFGYSPAERRHFCWLTNTKLGGPTLEEARAHTEEALFTLREGLLVASHVFLTFGTNHVYLHDGLVVSNCQRMPQREFVEKEMTVEECSSVLRGALERLRALNPKAHVVCTVSPYRYLKYGLHRNQLAKATLLLAIEALGADYFPAYEIFIDELRDYRFYAPDGVHPAAEGVEEVYRRLTAALTNSFL